MTWRFTQEDPSPDWVEEQVVVGLDDLDEEFANEICGREQPESKQEKDATVDYGFRFWQWGDPR